MSFLDNTDTQFSYQHSDGTIISCQSEPVHIDEITPYPMTEDEIPEELPEEQKEELRQLIRSGRTSLPIITKSYIEIQDDMITYYSTGAFSHSPNQIIDLRVEQASMDNINPTNYTYEVNDTYVRFFLSFSFIRVDTYIDNEGVKLKKTEELQGDYSIIFFFSTEEQAGVFIDKIIDALPNSESDKEAYRYLMKRPATMYTTVQMPVLSAPTSQVITEKGSSIVFKGNTYYKYDNKFYDAYFQEFAVYMGGHYTIDGTKSYEERNKVVLKNGQAIAYVDMGQAFYDQKKQDRYLTMSDGSICKFDRQIATYHNASHVASSWYMRDLVVLVDYFGL